MFSLKLIKSICSLNERALVSVLRYAQQSGPHRLKQTLGRLPRGSKHRPRARVWQKHLYSSGAIYPRLPVTPTERSRKLKACYETVLNSGLSTWVRFSRRTALNRTFFWQLSTAWMHSAGFRTKLKTIFQIQRTDLAGGSEGRWQVKRIQTWKLMHCG